MKLLKFAVVFLLAAVPMLASAQAKKKELNPWIDCGIGAMLFEEVTWAAVSSNIIWDLGTTAVISDQSSQNTCNSKKAKVALYIGATYANLSEETAKGDGKHLHAMLDILSCEPAAHGSIISSIRSDFGQSLREPGYGVKTSNAKAEDFYNIVQSTVSAAGYAQQCRI
jgi:hypothetical protein